MGPLPRAVVRAGPHMAAALLILVGLAAEVVRPLAPATGPPIAATSAFGEAYVARAAAYRAPVEAAQLAAIALRLLVAFTIAFSPAGRRAARAIACRIRHGPVAAALIATGAVVVIDLCILPLAFAIGYVHDGRFGLRTQGAGSWAAEWLVLHAPSWVAVGVVTLLAYWLARRLPNAWPLAAGLAMALLSVGVVVVAPLFLEPLQFRLVPLPQGPVRAEVETVLDRAGLAGASILVADASRRGPRQNAYISGLAGTRRIVLYDTLIQSRQPDEVGVVLAHEIGHQRHGDQLRSVAFGVAGAVMGAYVLAAVARRRTTSGHQRSPTDPSGAGVLVAVATLLVILSLPVQHAVSRRAEAAADAVSLALTAQPETMERMQIGLAKANLARPHPPAWVQVLLGSHPSAVERITRARRWPAPAGEAS